MDKKEKYVPNYVRENIKPVPFESRTGISKPHYSKNMPYIEAPLSAVRDCIPNVGNNVEQSWVGLDSHIIDDMNLDSGFNEVSESELIEFLEDDYVKSESIGDYVLIYKGSIISSGTLDYVQNEVKQMIFGTHDLCDGVNIDTEDLIVLKKVQIKVGVFLGD